MEQTQAMEAVAKALKQARSVIVTTHVNPDGDAVGSALGLAHLLRGAGKEVDVVSQDGAGNRYQFLPGSDEVLTGSDKGYDTGVAVDCGGIRRVGTVREALERCGRVIRIDHHASGEAFGDIEFVDASAAAVGEMIADLAEHMGLTMSKEVATCLLASIVEDTGCFQYASVSPRTFEICSRLVDAGADLHYVVQNLYWKAPEGAVRLAAQCVASAKMEAGGKLAWASATLADFEQHGALQEDVDEVVNDLLRIDGVEVSVLLRETERDWRVSLRSREYVDVAAVAASFGGGGHVRAAGCRIPRDQTSVRRLIDAASAAIEAR